MSTSPPTRPAHVVHQTSDCVIIETRRTVAPLNSAVLRAHAYATATNRPLVLVSAGNTRVTYPLALLLAQPDVQWVIEGGGLVRDGLTGRPVRWTGQRYDDVGANLRPRPPSPGTPGFLTVDIRSQWSAGGTGRPAQVCGAVSRALLSEMTGWGLAEPVSQPWHEAALGEFVAARAAAPLTLVVVGKAGTLAGTVGLRTDKETTFERTRLAIGFNREPGIDQAETVVRAVSETGTAVAAVVMWHSGRADTTRAPEAAPPGLPLGLLTTGGLTGAARGIGLDPVELGGGRCWVPFGLSPHRELAQLAGLLEP